MTKKDIFLWDSFINEAVKFIVLNRVGGEWPKYSVYFKGHRIKFSILKTGIWQWKFF